MSSTYRPRSLILSGIVLAASMLSGCVLDESSEAPASPAIPPQRPNFLVILADDLGFSDLGAFGGEISTPNLDQLASEGRLLTNFRTATMCSPSRAQLMSGTDHHQVGLGAMAELTSSSQRGQPGYEGYLTDRAHSIAELLRDNGYNTYMSGKWHLGLTQALGAKARGFEKSFILRGNSDLHYDTASVGRTRASQYSENGEEVAIPSTFFSTDYYTDKLISFIGNGRQDGKPFFAWAAYTAPHWPLQAPEAYLAKYRGKYDRGYEVLRQERFNRQKQLGLIPSSQVQGAPVVPAKASNALLWDDLTAEQKQFHARRMEVYAAMVDNLDHNIGRLIQHLKDIGEYDNTFIIFTSDNGPEGVYRDTGGGNDNAYDNLGKPSSYISQGPRWAEVSAVPFHLWKRTAGEGGVVVPTIVRMPGQKTAAPQLRQITSLTDIAPTLLELAGIADPGTQHGTRTGLRPITGVSLVSLLKDRSSVSRPAGTILAHELHGYAYVLQDQWKLAYQYNGEGSGAWELFDLASDPGEQQDVSSARVDKVDVLKQAFRDYATRVGLVPYAVNAPPQ